MDFVRILDVAKRNDLTLYRTAKKAEFKAHCPACQDTRRQFHLYVSALKDAFYCHKCGAHGGVIAFHAWLRAMSFEAAKADLYPVTLSVQTPRTNTRKKHPAKQLTREQLAALQLTPQTPQKRPPAGISRAQWAQHQEAELNWIWSLWLDYERRQRQLSRNLLLLGLQSGWVYRPLVLKNARRVKVAHSTLGKS